MFGRKSPIAIACIGVMCCANVGVANPDPRFDHWAFQSPVATTPPAVVDEWVANPIDAFIAHRLAQEELSPAPEADRRTLIRRVTLDLIGLPPTVEEVESFVADERPDAYDRLVDRLLASPHYGERHAQVWLDLARYADTNGYEKDRPRTIWPYRDWVVNALNDDMPYDQFVIEQIAGDLLPNATPEQHIATGFLRNSMLNEEGGVDVEEFRFEAMVDRVNTVSAAVLGLTVSCAQCHDHKYDPMTHEEYFQFTAYLNNTDDVTTPVITEAIRTKREAIQEEVSKLESGLLDAYLTGPPPVDLLPLTTRSAESSGGAKLEATEDGWVTASGKRPPKDEYRVVLSAPEGGLDGLRLTTDIAGSKGPGRAENGNFVLSEIRVQLDGETVPISMARATREQSNFPPSHTFDSELNTGWAIDDGAPLSTNPPYLEIQFENKINVTADQAMTVELIHDYGNRHTLGKFRIDGFNYKVSESGAPERAQRMQILEDSVDAWIADLESKATDWTIAGPTLLHSANRSTLWRMGDNSILVAGDNPNQDTYTVTLRTDLPRVTGIRLEALTHESLPDGGPGRAPLFSVGDFMLSEIGIEAAPWSDPESAAPLEIASATSDYAAGGRDPGLALDGRMDTGWSVGGAIGRDHRAVFQLAEPFETGGDALVRISLEQIFIHNHTLGRFRISLTGDDGEIVAVDVPAEIEALVARGEFSEEERATLTEYYLGIAPELKHVHAKIEALRKSMPAYPESLTLGERTDVRQTHFYHRGEYLQRRQAVSPGTPAMLHAFPENVPHTRLQFARWLTSRESPLTARVAVNRAWQMYFGRGFVDTPEDFGLQGSKPSHPELYDWLAIEFMNQGWSMKELARLIVTSATYRQSSNVTPALYNRDPYNVLLARGPRFRIGAEAVRDSALAASGLLNPTMGGPGEYLKLPEGLLSTVYPGGAWPEAQGDARYRRGIYTYWKRILPFPTMTTFDAPTRDVACTRRARSNTPLQALTLLNDDVTMEAARALAANAIAEGGGEFAATLDAAYLRCLARRATGSEHESIRAFYDRHRARIIDEGIDTTEITGGESNPDFAAWVLVCRAILNLDETITKT